MTFDEWLASEHRATFIHLRLRELDLTPVSHEPSRLLENEARRSELRLLETWRPPVEDEEAPKAQARTLYKAGEYRREHRKVN